jgi:hypothetical protein
MPASFKKFFDKLNRLFSANKRYKCQICGKMVHQLRSLEHAKAEEYLLNLVKKDHPRWREQDSVCRECIEYYRKLIKQAEI